MEAEICCGDIEELGWRGVRRWRQGQDTSASESVCGVDPAVEVRLQAVD